METSSASNQKSQINLRLVCTKLFEHTTLKQFYKIATIYASILLL